MSKNIYIVTPFESILEGRGTRYPELSRLLSKSHKNYNIEYITTDFSHQDKLHFDVNHIDQVKREINGGYKFTVLPIKGYKKNISISRVVSHISLSFKYYTYLKAKVKEGDVIVISSIPPELVYAISHLKRKVKVKIVLDVRDIWPDSFNINSNVLNFIFSVYCNFVYSRIVLKIDRFITVAPGFNKWFDRYNVTNYKFIPLGFDSKRWDKKIEKKFNYRIVYIGYLNSQFDISLFVKYINIQKELSFDVVGGG
jgi:hypothetical protein